jgi:hypothetical protein
MIDVAHIEAAAAAWHYVEASTRYIFSWHTGDEIADKLFAALVKAGDHGLTSTEQNDVFGGHVKSPRLEEARRILEERGLIVMREQPTAGRPVFRCFIAENAEQAEQAEKPLPRRLSPIRLSRKARTEVENTNATRERGNDDHSCSRDDAPPWALRKGRSIVTRLPPPAGVRSQSRGAQEHRARGTVSVAAKPCDPCTSATRPPEFYCSVPTPGPSHPSRIVCSARTRRCPRAGDCSGASSDQWGPRPTPADCLRHRLCGVSRYGSRGPISRRCLPRGIVQGGIASA